MKTHQTLFVLICLLTISGCQSKAGKAASTNESTPFAETTEIPSKELPALVPGEASLTEADMGQIIELKGIQKSLEDAPIFKLSETQTIIKDSFFIVQNYAPNENGKIVQVFSYPDLKFLFDFGERGNAPGQYIYPNLSYTCEKDKLCYLYDPDLKSLTEVSSNKTQAQIPIHFREEKKAVSNSKQLYVAEKGTYYYSAPIRQGQAIFRAIEKEDSIETTLLYNLAFSPKHKSWTAYIGDFCVNTARNRMVYAYKYFKRISIMDMEAKTVKHICFDKEGVQATNDIITLGPDNTTYYWGISSTDDYFFLTYSGRTPIEVSKETQKGDGSIFVEQFDWNGNPVAKYKLDKWGRTICDGKQIYLFSYRYDDPLFIYTLPK